jgi:hypothetical protein
MIASPDEQEVICMRTFVEKSRCRRALMLSLVVLAAALGATPLLAKSGSTRANPPSATNVSRGLAKKYIAAGNALNAKALATLFAPNAVEVDKAGGSVFTGRDQIIGAWSEAFYRMDSWHGTLICASPEWAIVGWVVRTPASSNPATHKPFKGSGISVLEIKNSAIVRGIKNSVITHETLYYDQPGQ